MDIFPIHPLGIKKQNRTFSENPICRVKCFCNYTFILFFLIFFYINLSFQIPIDCFEEPWVIFRGKDGKPGCVQNTCAHRACPLHLGSVNDGRIQCPYHGKLKNNRTRTPQAFQCPNVI